MDIAIISIVLGIVALALFLLLVARVLRLALKLVMAGVVIVALLTAGVLGWWQGWFRLPMSPNATQQRPAPTRRVSSH